MRKEGNGGWEGREAERKGNKKRRKQEEGRWVELRS